MEQPPHVVLTGDTDWDPSVLDNQIDDNENWFDAVSDFTDNGSTPLFDLQSNYRHRHVVHCIDINSPHLEDGVLPTCPQLLDVYDAKITDTVRNITLKEAIQHDVPEALGRPVVLTHYVDAKRYHDMLTGRLVTRILHLINQTPIDWFSKRQPTAETAT